MAVRGRTDASFKSGPFYTPLDTWDSKSFASGTLSSTDSWVISSTDLTVSKLDWAAEPQICSLASAARLRATRPTVLADSPTGYLPIRIQFTSSTLQTRQVLTRSRTMAGQYRRPGLVSTRVGGCTRRSFRTASCIFWVGRVACTAKKCGVQPRLEYSMSLQTLSVSSRSTRHSAGFSGSCGVSLPSGSGLLFGGSDSSGSALSDFVWSFDPSSLKLTAATTTGAGPSPRWGVSCAASADGKKVYVHGGCDPSGKAPSDGAIYILDTAKMSWTSIPDPKTAGAPGPRCFGAGAVYKDYFVTLGGQVPPSATVKRRSVGSQGFWDRMRVPAKVAVTQNEFHPDRLMSNADSAGSGTDGFYVFSSSQSSWTASGDVQSLDVALPATSSGSSSSSSATATSPSASSSTTGTQTSTQPSASSSGDSGDGGGGLSTGMKVLIAFGCLLGVAILGLLIGIAVIRTHKNPPSKKGSWGSRASGTNGFQPLGHDNHYHHEVPVETAAASQEMQSSPSGPFLVPSAEPRLNRQISTASNRSSKLFGDRRSLTIRGTNSFSFTRSLKEEEEHAAGAIGPSQTIRTEPSETSDLSNIFKVGGPSPSGGQPSLSPSPIPAVTVASTAVVAAAKTALLAEPTPTLPRHASGRARQVNGLRLLDPERNVPIPLLAPIDEIVEDDAGSTVAVGTASEMTMQVEKLIFDELGDLSLCPLDLPVAGEMGLELTSMPLRTSSMAAAEGGIGGVVQIPEELVANVRFQCMYKHGARSSDELELRYGDTVVVRKFYKDAWAEGINYSTGKVGVFPLFVVEEADSLTPFHVGGVLCKGQGAVVVRRPDKVWEGAS
ncbi:hypothetical protein DFJ73DRAFT_88632 [Zopfochytrium polystomum]|nr:hypothetical protein DFJ73DRAFT_88632 [Zopfochytrium polystomum]